MACPSHGVHELDRSPRLDAAWHAVGLPRLGLTTCRHRGRLRSAEPCNLDGPGSRV
jgi:hypothetical protein